MVNEIVSAVIGAASIGLIYSLVKLYIDLRTGELEQIIKLKKEIKNINRDIQKTNMEIQSTRYKINNK